MAIKTAHLENGLVSYGETHFFVGSNFIVSIRHGASSSYKQVREHFEKNTKMLSKGPRFVIYALLDFVVDNYQPIVENFERNFNVLEADIFKGKFDRLVIERIYDLKCELMELRNAATPISDICSELFRFHDGLISKDFNPLDRRSSGADNRISKTRIILFIDCICMVPANGYQPMLRRS